MIVVALTAAAVKVFARHEPSAPGQHPGQVLDVVVQPIRPGIQRLAPGPCLRLRGRETADRHRVDLGEVQLLQDAVELRKLGGVVRGPLVTTAAAAAAAAAATG
jgi:hypothetical protein